MDKISWDDIEVSRLCFGALPMGPSQKDMPPEEGGRLLLRAFEMGVNFVDTAQSYRTYPHIRYALDRWDGPVYIATKSAAETYEDMEEAVSEALGELGREHIDIFHLHAARVGTDVFEKRAGALECLKEYTERGVVGKIGISTHSVPVVERAGEQEDVQVVYPIINSAGLGILEGDTRDMIRAIGEAHDAGKFLYAMKVFAGGNLIDERQEALDYVLSIRGMGVVSIGMVNESELEVNVGLMKGEVDPRLYEETGRSSKRLMIARFCAACSTCLEHCPNEALYIEGDQCLLDRDRCILCGYCAPMCPQFAIRMI